MPIFSNWASFEPTSGLGPGPGRWPISSPVHGPHTLILKPTVGDSRQAHQHPHFLDT
jgi:hypothetical protein